MLKKILSMCALGTSALMAGILTNGDLSYGDGGWYVWNNPDGPAKYEAKIGEICLMVTAAGMSGTTPMAPPSTKPRLARWDSVSTAVKVSSLR